MNLPNILMVHWEYFLILKKKETGEEYLRVTFERPMEYGFDTYVIELPSYKVVLEDGNYSDVVMFMVKVILFFIISLMLSLTLNVALTAVLYKNWVDKQLHK